MAYILNYIILESHSQSLPCTLPLLFTLYSTHQTKPIVFQDTSHQHTSLLNHCLILLNTRPILPLPRFQCRPTHLQIRLSHSPMLAVAMSTTLDISKLGIYCSSRLCSINDTSLFIIIS